MDGLEWLEEIRRFSKMPIVVVSARHNAQIIAQAKALGATEYVTKPFKIDFLANRIRELVNLAT
jgi:two-component system KDP operon response regulator KdpE